MDSSPNGFQWINSIPKQKHWNWNYSNQQLYVLETNVLLHSPKTGNNNDLKFPKTPKGIRAAYESEQTNQFFNILSPNFISLLQTLEWMSTIFVHI